MTGTSVVFGYLGGGPVPFAVKTPAASYILAFRALPLVLVISALSCLLFQWRVLLAIVQGFSILFQKSLGIMLGGLGTMVPDRRGEIVSLGLKSIVAGTLATCMTGAVVGLLSVLLG
jgi:nucleoside permease NupC